MITNVIKINLETLLAERGKTLYALSRETGVAYNALSKIKKNEVKSISFDVLEKLCVNLNCQAGELIEVVPNDLLALSDDVPKGKGKAK